MSDLENQDETQGFIVESSDLPETEVEQDQQEDQSNDDDQAEVESNDQQESEGESSENSGNDEAAEQGKSKKSNRVQERINKVTREREEARREVERLRAQLEDSSSKKQAETGQEPKEDDYDTYDAYLEALDKYDSAPDESSKSKDSGTDDKDAPSLSESQKTALAVIRETLSATTLPDDFEQVALDQSLNVTGEMLEALAECDDPAKVMYHLGKNKEMAAEIAGKSPAQQMRAIAKLDMTVKVAPPKPVKATNAPDPIKPVGGSDAQPKSHKEMSFAEFEAARNKEERGR